MPGYNYTGADKIISGGSCYGEIEPQAPHYYLSMAIIDNATITDCSSDQDDCMITLLQYIRCLQNRSESSLYSQIQENVS